MPRAVGAPETLDLLGLGLLLLLLLVRAPGMGCARSPRQAALGPDLGAEVLQALGLQRLPDLSKANVSQTEYERAHNEYLTRLRRSAGEDQRRRRLVTVYATGEPMYDGIRLSFPVAVEEARSAVVESATLRLFLDHADDSEEIEVWLHRLSGPGEQPRRLLGRRALLSPRRWLELDVSNELTDLTTSSSLDLLVQMLDEEARAAFGARVASAALNLHLVYPGRATITRSRRSAREQLLSLQRGRRTECRGEGRKCCRHHMPVTFKDLQGFDFIIQPKSFDAGYCKGRCPPRYNPAHHHALLQSLIWKEDRKRAPRPCCAPSKLTELEILYFDENDPTKLKVSNWKDMRVLECACS